MSEEKKTPKTSWFTGLKTEFRKIIWPTKDSLIRETVAVLVSTVVLALIIAGIDYLVQYGIDILVNLS
ncbi:MAG: preprotein translocase subunit SecE [Lachnospiraceae bacterium]|jgi:preprotein translocase subunit SecE|nr:preprotein translocase subunit SecE [Lachnospiraceae bacterium]